MFHCRAPIRTFVAVVRGPCTAADPRPLEVARQVPPSPTFPKVTLPRNPGKADHCNEAIGKQRKTVKKKTLNQGSSRHILPHMRVRFRICILIRHFIGHCANSRGCDSVVRQETIMGHARVLKS